jgi:RimJ/RimL family protein N-acetyltransferase
VGQALVHKVKQWAKSQGEYTKLLLMVADYNTPAIRLYESCGFKPSGIPFDYGERLPEQEYVCPL